MLTKTEIETANTNSNGKLFEVIKLLQKLREDGKNDQELSDIIYQANYPLSFHLFLMGNFTFLMDLKIN